MIAVVFFTKIPVQFAMLAVQLIVFPRVLHLKLLVQPPVFPGRHERVAAVSPAMLLI